MRSCYIAAVGVVAASGLASAGVVPANFKRDDDYTNEVVIMVQCNRMQDDSDTPYGTKDQMWWWSDYDTVFVDQTSVNYETAYVYAPGQDNPTYVDWTAGTTDDPLTADLRGQSFELYKQAKSGDSNTHVTGTGTYGGNDFSCYDTPKLNFYEPVSDGVQYVCQNKYLCTRSSRDLTRTEIEISEGIYNVTADGTYPMEVPGVVEGVSLEEADEKSRAWAETMYKMLIEAESSGTDADKPYDMGDSGYNMYFNIERAEKEGDAHWDANRVTSIANELASKVPSQLVSERTTDCANNAVSATCQWVLPFPHQIIVRFQVAKQNDPRWITQDTFTITVEPDEASSDCVLVARIATLIGGVLSTISGNVAAFGSSITTLIAGGSCLV
ncbi:hypothetical protein B0J13DRAFT_629289 [Dactylonectria estremocensis]|uniref:Uncharacterized protein n=1 Tax=Dactylonectria estremocensis TaxID=1079267 RepID=A0A9P9DGZ3_9HYPO|nr:hypothetical protein B0J13DRAFT_629289 [Dactylonectria estremocensis]